MPDLSWNEFRRRCQKPNGDRLGSWTAQKFARPVALRITKVIAPTGISAHQVTLVALAVGLLSAVAFAFGAPLAWLAGALLLELWYVLDHVDGQLARWRRTASLDGTMLDYLMHHVVNLVIPQAIAFGLVTTTGQTAWFVVGIGWSCGLVLLGVRHDARYKAFNQRLKVVEGNLIAVGGGGGRPTPSAWPKRSVRSAASWSVQKVCEMHVLAHVLVALAIVRLWLPDFAAVVAQSAVVAMSLPAMLLPAMLIARSLRRGEAEAEFALWHRVPADSTLEFRDGRYVVASPGGDVLSPANEPRREVVRTS